MWQRGSADGACGRGAEWGSVARVELIGLFVIGSLVVALFALLLVLILRALGARWPEWRTVAVCVASWACWFLWTVAMPYAVVGNRAPPGAAVRRYAYEGLYIHSDFTCTEEQFRAWVAGRGWRLGYDIEIADGVWEFVPATDPQALYAMPYSDPQHPLTEAGRIAVPATQGLIVEQRERDGGGHRAVWDRRTGRGTYWYSWN